MKIIRKIKFQTLKSSLIVLSIALTVTSCQHNDEDIEVSKVIITDFKATELAKMHGGDQKSWRLTEVIIPEQYKNHPNVLNNDCVSDDVYTFNASESNESLEEVSINLGINRCFETISDSENFEAKLLYVPYNLNGEQVVEVTLILEYSIIKNIDNSTVTNIDAYRLSELTEDRMVFSTGAAYVGEYSFAYVFEKIDD